MKDQTNALVKAILVRVDRKRWQRSKEKWESAGAEAISRGEKPDRVLRHARNYSKYYDLDHWIRYHLGCLAHLDLDSDRQPLRILDLGCGSGIFSFLCNHFGHRAEGLDIESPMYAEMTEILGVPILRCTIRPMTPLPDSIRGYDLFSAISIKFDRDDFATNRPAPWDLSEWQFLIEDLAARLNPGGRIYIKPNSFNGVAGFGNQAISDYFASISDQTILAPLAYIVGRDRVLGARSSGR